MPPTQDTGLATIIIPLGIRSRMLMLLIPERRVMHVTRVDSYLSRYVKKVAHCRYSYLGFAL